EAWLQVASRSVREGILLRAVGVRNEVAGKEPALHREAREKRLVLYPEILGIVGVEELADIVDPRVPALTRQKALVVRIADVDHDVAAVAGEVGACGRADLVARRVTELGDAVLALHQKAL